MMHTKLEDEFASSYELQTLLIETGWIIRYQLEGPRAAGDMGLTQVTVECRLLWRNGVHLDLRGIGSGYSVGEALQDAAVEGITRGAKGYWEEGVEEKDAQSSGD